MNDITKPFDGIDSKPLEASPVVSNTTLAHDRLGGVMSRLTSSDKSTLALLSETYHLLMECGVELDVMDEIENHIVLNKEIPHT